MTNTDTAPLESSKIPSAENFLGLDKQSESDLIAAISRGLPFGTLETLADNSGLALDRLARVLKLHPAKLARRKGQGKLTSSESDHLVSLTRAIARSIDLFDGDIKAAAHWFVTPSPALGNVAPVEMTKTHAGCRAVDSLIGRLKHGVFT